MIVMRHGTSGAPYLAAEVFSGGVLNGGDGWHAHPSQALLDLYTMRAHLGDLRGRKVVILGDVLHSRVARSNIWTLTAMGADLWICGPTPILRGFDAWAGRWANGRGPGRSRRLHRDLRRRRGPRGRRRRHGPAAPARADGRRAPAEPPRVRGALRADPGAAGGGEARRPGHAPGADERGRRDRAGRRGAWTGA